MILKFVNSFTHLQLKYTRSFPAKEVEHLQCYLMKREFPSPLWTRLDTANERLLRRATLLDSWLLGLPFNLKISFVSLHLYFLYRSLDTILSSAVQGLSVLESHLVEVEGDTLCLYGAGALECLDRNWSVQTAGIIVTVSFMFIEFDEIVQVLTKLKIKFPNFVVRMPQISSV